MDVTHAKYADAVHKSQCKSTELLPMRAGSTERTKRHCTRTPGSAAALALCLRTFPDLSPRFMSSEYVSAGKLVKYTDLFALAGGTIFLGVDEDSSPPPLL